MDVELFYGDTSFFSWLTLSTLTVLVLTAYILHSLRAAWPSRGIKGLDERWKLFVATIASLLIGGFSFALLGLSFGFAFTIASYVLIISSFTDYASCKAPRELTLFSGIGIATVAAVDWFVYRSTGYSAVADIGVFAVAVSIIALAIMFVAVRLVSPGGLGMADVRILLMLSLISYWLGAGYILLVVLFASLSQLLIKISLKVNKKSKDKLPFIPALTAGALMAFPVSLFLVA